MIRYECTGGVLLAVIAVRNEKRKSEYPIAKKWDRISTLEFQTKRIGCFPLNDGRYKQCTRG